MRERRDSESRLCIAECNAFLGGRNNGRRGAAGISVSWAERDTRLAQMEGALFGVALQILTSYVATQPRAASSAWKGHANSMRPRLQSASRLRGRGQSTRSIPPQTPTRIRLWQESSPQSAGHPRRRDTAVAAVRRKVLVRNRDLQILASSSLRPPGLLLIFRPPSGIAPGW